MPAPRYQKRHLSNDGIWRVCRASTRGCGLSQHRSGAQFSHLRAMSAKGRPIKRSDSSVLPFELLGHSVADWSPFADESDVRLAPDGLSGKWCGACGAYLTSLALSEVSEHDMLDCPNCESELLVNELPVDFCEDQVRFLNDSEVLSSHWFHISERANWDAGTKADGVVTHLGSKHAAMERMAQLIAQKGTNGKQFYLHEIVLDQAVQVKPGIWNDQVGWPEEVGKIREDVDGGVGVRKGEVLRYMNFYEGPGTVSIMADPNAYTLLASAPIPLIVSDKRTY